jgi:hypothetical protein
MIELLIAACLSTGTPECRDFSVLYDSNDVSVLACTLHGQRQIAVWKETHPGWRVARWTCSYKVPGAVDI